MTRLLRCKRPRFFALTLVLLGAVLMTLFPASAQADPPALPVSNRADFPPELAAIIKHEAGSRLADHGSFFLDSFSDDAMMDFPFDPSGGFSVQGQKAIRELFVKVEQTIRIEHVVLTRTYHTDDDNSIIIEYTSRPRFLKGDVSFSQQYIAVVEFKAGKIVLFREYINPLKPLEALGRLSAPNPRR